MAVYRAELSDYVPSLELPLYVEYVAAGLHPARVMHSHDFTELVVVLEGDAVSIEDNNKFQIARGDVLLLPPGVVHGYDYVKTMGIVNVCYNVDKLPIPLLDCHSLPLFHAFFPVEKTGEKIDVTRPIIHLSEKELRSVARIIKCLSGVLEAKHPGYSFHSLALFMELLAELCYTECQVSIEQPAELLRLGDSLEYIRTHFREKLTIGHLARLAHMSVRSFHREFRTMTGYSPHEYQNRIRLQFARHLLQNSDSSIAAVAEASGFYDSCHLNKLFHLAFGMTPKQFSLQCRKTVLK